MKKLQLTTLLSLLFFSLAMLVSCGDNDNEPEGGGSENGGTIIVQNAYTSTYVGNINRVAITNSKGEYIKTSTKAIKKGDSQTFENIPAGTYSIDISVNDRLGPKPVTKSGVKVTNGKTTNVVFK